MVKIGEETSEQLDYQPASLFVTEHVRFTYACQACEGTVVMAERPAAPIEKGRPGPGLLAQVVTAKYADHVPLNRQTEIFARHGVTLARQTLCDWVAAAADLLTPLYEDLKDRLLASKVIHTDDTVVPVLDRERTATREGRLWVYVSDGHPADLVYDYTADRTRAGPLAFLGDFRGYLQADAYAGYDALYATGRVVEVACWAHARRYFFDAKASDPARALPALGFIQQLYAVEREVKGADAETRRARRAEQALPVLARFRQWLDAQADVVLPKSPIGEAVGYARAQWTALTRYCEDGDLAIDNNVSERALRKVVTGRTTGRSVGVMPAGARRDPLQPRRDVQGARPRPVGLSARRARADSHPSQSPPRRTAPASLDACPVPYTYAGITRRTPLAAPPLPLLPLIIPSRSARRAVVFTGRIRGPASRLAALLCLRGC